MSCDVQGLLQSGNGLLGLTPWQRQVVFTRLLYQIAGSSQSMSELLAGNAGLTPKQLKVIRTEVFRHLACP